MATRALLLSRDEQAVDALTQALGELGCAFEHSSEPSFGIKRLSNRRFDVVLVDCDNEQNATQVFDCARGSTLNQESITVAVVDGKAGVPNAFRLGANLVLTKPVSLEQAKATLRTAIGRLRKEAHAQKAPLNRPAAVPTKNAVSVAAVQSPAIRNEPTQSAHPMSTPVPPPRLPQADAGPSLASKPRVQGVSTPSSTSECPSTRHPTIDEIRFSFVPLPTSMDAVTAKKNAGAEGMPASARPYNPRLEDDDPILAELKELESRGSVLPPSAFGTPEKRNRSKALLLVAVIGLLVATGLFVAWITQPRVRSLGTYEYQAALGRIASFRTKRQAIASTTPAQPLPHAANSVVPSLRQPSAAQAVEADTRDSDSGPTAEPASTSAPATGAKAFPRAASLQDVKQDNPAGSTDAVPALAPATSTTPRSGFDKANEPMVLPEDVADGNVVHRVRPVYPKRAQQKRVHGTVRLQVIIDTEGKVDSVQVLDGNPLLAHAAVDAVKQWRYKTFFHHEEAVAVETRVTLDFR